MGYGKVSTESARPCSRFPVTLLVVEEVGQEDLGEPVLVDGLGLVLKDLGVAEQVFGLVLVLVVPRLLLLFGHCAF